MPDSDQNIRFRVGLLVAALAFTSIAIYGSLTPLQFRALGMGEAIARFREIPMLSISLERRADWVSNILLFVPLGFFWLGVIAFGRSRTTCVIGTLVASGALVLLSGAIEFTQLWFPPRTVSQNDILAESIGGVIGCMLWLAVGGSMVATWKQFIGSRTVGGRLRWMLLTYSIGLAIYSVMPLDLTISPGELYQKLKMGRVRLVPFQFDDVRPVPLAWGILCDVAVFIPVGWACVSWIGGNVSKRFSVLIAGMIFVAALEAAQILVYSRYADTTDLITGWAGVLIGMWTWHRLPNSEQPMPELDPQTTLRDCMGWWCGVIGVAIAICIVYWHPYDFSLARDTIKPRLDAFTTALFEPLYWGSELHALVIITRKTLTFGMLGISVAIATRRSGLNESAQRFLSAVSIGACWAFALLVELVQVLLPSHTAHWTDVMIGGLGASLGLGLVAVLFRQPDHQQVIE